MVNWLGFGIAVVLLDIIPLWILDFGISDFSILTKLFYTVALAAVCWFAVEYGGAKRGFISR